jgi:hypothetical protein
LEPIGRKRRAIAEGCFPSLGSFYHRAVISHGTACICNAVDRNAVFFVDREPVDSYNVTVAARRALQLRFNNLKGPSPIHCDTEFCLGVRIRCPDRAATHAARFTSRRVQPAFNNGLLQKT